MEVWSANIEMIKQFPVFGVGWHHNSELSHAFYTSKGIKGFESHGHNNFIDQWATTGLFGLLSYLWWCLAIVVMSFKIYRANHDLLWRSLGLGFVGGWFCLHLNGLTQANFWDAKVLHQNWVGYRFDDGSLSSLWPLYFLIAFTMILNPVGSFSA